MKKIITIILLATSLLSSAQVHKGLSANELRSSQNKIAQQLGKYPEIFRPWLSESERKVRLERVACSEGRVNLYFNLALIQIAIREDLCKLWEDEIRTQLGEKYADATIGLFFNNVPIERYIPNIYRKNIARDTKRLAKPYTGSPLIKQIDDVAYSKGLQNRHIALWPSHGRYYDQEDSTWKFQRPPLFGTIEDLHTFLYCDKYLIPMLENAGAIVISPRERDRQTNMVIIDNDRSSIGAKVLFSEGWTKISGGYKHRDTLTSQNPFFEGSYMKSPATGGTATYIATIPTRGEYAVYVSYKALQSNAINALYTIEYMGGSATFRVNQTMGGEWIYLGKFTFAGSAKITLKSDGPITADAIRLGGGMGSVKRGATTSGSPRWAEAARYYMQFSGVPQTLYKQQHQTKKESDYMDDYKSRGDWVNYLRLMQRIPIDVALALHSNAGIVDTTFGTLTINFTNKGSGNYANGGSKFAGRDMADIIHTQIVEDIRSQFDSTWTRRSIYDKSYAEISRPDVPAVIVEMFSHQNFNDMKLALTPAFRFTTARAIYKGILKFLASRYTLPYTVQPLPVSNLSLTTSGDQLTLKWKPTIDTIEPSAYAENYKVYMRVGSSTFDKGVKTAKLTAEYDIKPDGLLRTYYVTASNSGGESFPSEILAACFYENSHKSLIIKDIDSRISFDTISGPLRRGFDIDPKTSLQDDYSIVGRQIEFDPNVEYISDPEPGWGKSDFSLLYKGVTDTANDVLRKLIARLQKEKASFIITSSETIDNISYNVDNVYIITNKSAEKIALHYKSLFPPETAIHVTSVDGGK